MYDRGDSLTEIILAVQAYAHHYHEELRARMITFYDFGELKDFVQPEILRTKGWFYRPDLKLLFVISKSRAKKSWCCSFNLNGIKVLEPDFGVNSDVDYVLWRLI
jgi:hypothetical protein